MSDVLKRPYIEMGRFLRTWRESRFESAKDFVQSAELTIKYSLYVAYERGEALPTPAILLELSQVLERPVTDALALWAAVQMPTPELRSVFWDQGEGRLSIASDSSGSDLSAKTITPYVIDSATIPPSAFDNTWVFGSAEKAVFQKKPWLFELLVQLSIRWPERQTAQTFGFQSDADFTAFVQAHLKPWIEDGWIQSDRKGIQLTQPYIHIPKNEAWAEFRESLLRRVFDQAAPQLSLTRIRDGHAHRTLTTRMLSPAQKAEWIAQLKALEEKFSRTPYVPSGVSVDGNSEAYTLMMTLTERRLPHLSAKKR